MRVDPPQVHIGFILLKLCENFNQQYGTEFVSVMPTNLYGPGDNYHPTGSHVLPAMIRRFDEALENNTPEVTCWGSGNPLREFLHSDDLGSACVFALENWKPNAKGRDYTWLLNACRQADHIIMNMDYSSNQLRVWAGYILTLSKTFFINSNFDDAQAFSVLNRNKIAGIPELLPKIAKIKADR